MTVIIRPPHCRTRLWPTRLLLIGLFALTGSTTFAATARDFAWRRPIPGPTETGELLRIPITEDLYGLTSRFPNDIRVLDEDGTPWPFFHYAPRPQHTTDPVPHTILNRAWFAGGPAEPSYYRLDLQIFPDNTGRPRQHNQVRLTTTGSDFIRRVEIYGAESPGDWGLLGAGYLVNHRHPRRVEDIVTYSEASYPYLQIRVYANVRNALEEVEVSSIALQRRTTTRPYATREIPHELLPLPRSERQDDTQIILLRTTYAGQPVHSIRITAQGDYVRRVTLSTRNTDRDPWRFAGSGDVYQVGPLRQTTLIANGRGAFWKLHIPHYDDAPLEIEELELRTAVDYLIIEAASERDAMLYFGSDRVTSARYDLRARFEQMSLSPDSLPERILEERQTNPAHQLHRMQRLEPWLIPAAIAVASLTVVWIVVRMFRHFPMSP